MVKKLIHIFARAPKNLSYFLLPQNCVGCGARHTYLCRECLEKISYPEFASRKIVLAAGSYKDRWLKKTIWILKYKKGMSAAEPLAELIFRRIFCEGKIKEPEKFLFVPIPLSPKRQAERGFNQSEAIALFLLKKLKLPKEQLKNGALVKIKETKPQASIKKYEERVKNLQGSFKVRQAEKIRGRKIILIDDVSTTGTTIAEASKVLRKNGARKIIAVTAAA